jgi:hypothetical protein
MSVFTGISGIGTELLCTLVNDDDIFTVSCVDYLIPGQVLGTLRCGYNVVPGPILATFIEAHYKPFMSNGQVMYLFPATSHPYVQVWMKWRQPGVLWKVETSKMI